MTNILSVIALLFAIVCLSLAMQKHYKACFDGRLHENKEKLLKVGGWLLMALSISLVERKGISYVVWTCQLALVIFLQAWLLSAIAKQKTERKAEQKTNKEQTKN
ncbi:DUF3325 domain-containing protein [Thalassotalea euphylliae]|uniref:DUF3325 domain-containing protein n=1 Tax=Thalassotalea euphylliae TaxID=1655234 RepID=A0A3E0UCQ7_9GAMM|nr:DUF3325 domain-containing protein [Thalassotalea euphylliae]REL34676.1 DUF3325 domain-containing protein [Thalassotalea euphylliae]